ncbi:MAG: response regulator transcription factor [Dehalococcoidales bacterium]|nr:response regulator transcription factor [Dehalococcoidales bacterium]
MIRILIADDHPLIREAIRHALERREDMEIVGEASDGEEAVRMAKEFLPDVLIMDISMPRLNGIEATRVIKKCYLTSLL